MIPNLQLKLCNSHHSLPFNYATFYSFSKILFIHHSLLAFPTYASGLFYFVAFLTSHINCHCPWGEVVGTLPSQLLIPSIWPRPTCCLLSSLSKQELFTFFFISPSTHQFNRNQGFSENLLQMIPTCLFSHSTYITLQKLLNHSLNSEFHQWKITRKWLQHDLILISYNCNDPVSEKVTFWGSGGYDFNIYLGGTTIQPITPSSGFVVFLYCIFDFQVINSQTYLYYCLLSSSFRLHLLIIF